MSRWQGGYKSAAALVGTSAHLEFALFQVRIYIRWDFHIQYGGPVIERI